MNTLLIFITLEEASELVTTTHFIDYSFKKLIYNSLLKKMYYIGMKIVS